MTAPLCQWQVYALKDNIDLDSASFVLDDCFDVIACDKVATQEYEWSTERGRKTYGQDKTPVCDEHVEQFRMTDRISKWVEEQNASRS